MEGDSPRQGSDGNNIKPNFGIVRTPLGILMIINMILLFLAWVILAGYTSGYYHSAASFFTATTIIPWLLFLVLFLLFLFNVHSRLTMINWPLTMLINCVVWGVLIVISTIVLLVTFYQSATMIIIEMFGIFSAIGLGVQAFFHFKEYKEGN